jgi:hypothetical protein
VTRLSSAMRSKCLLTFSMSRRCSGQSGIRPPFVHYRPGHRVECPAFFAGCGKSASALPPSRSSDGLQKAPPEPTCRFGGYKPQKHVRSCPVAVYDGYAGLAARSSSFKPGDHMR